MQGAKSGGQVPAPIGAKIIEEILALDKGYNPGVKALDPAVGNFKFVESVNFKDSDVLAQSAAQDEETSETAPDAVDVRKKVTKAKTVRPDIRPQADDHGVPPRAQPVQPAKRRSFFDFLRKKTKEEQPSQQPQQQPEEQKKKKRFVFF